MSAKLNLKSGCLSGPERGGILFVVGAWGIGGVERVTAVLSNAFVQHGYRVVIAAFSVDDACLLKTLDPRVRVERLSFPIRQMANLSRLQTILKTQGIRYIINQWCLPLPVTSLLNRARRGTEARLIAVHHNIPNQNGRINAARNSLLKMVWKVLSALSLRWVYKGSDAYVVLSKRFEAIFQTFIKLRCTPKLHTVTNPLTLPLASGGQPRENRLLYVGRLEEVQKKVSRIIDMWGVLSAKFPDWELDIVGDGPDRARLEAQASGMERIRFYGFQEPSSFYHRSRLLLLTSDFEGFPLVLAEAMVRGCVPVVLGSYPAAYDIVRGTNGVVVAPPYDGEAFVKVLADLMARPDVIRGMSETAVETVADYSVDSVMHIWQDLFRKLDGRRGDVSC